jgi:uncharacterized protein Yka (UPF0111/DUF47 family)
LETQYIKQMADNIEKLNNKFDDIGNRLTKIETMFTMFDKAQTNLLNKVDNVERVAHDAMASTKAAHKRLDELNDDFDKINSIPEHAKRLDKLERIIYWAGTTIIGGLVLGAIGLLFKLSK